MRIIHLEVSLIATAKPVTAPARIALTESCNYLKTFSVAVYENPGAVLVSSLEVGEASESMKVSERRLHLAVSACREGTYASQLWGKKRNQVVSDDALGRRLL